MGDDKNTVGDAFDKFLDRSEPRWPFFVIAVSVAYLAWHLLPWAVNELKIVGEIK